MPPPPTSRPIEVLITGFGPFGPFNSNPSWEAVDPLHEVELDLSCPPSSAASSSASSTSAARKVRIQTLQSAVCYSHILSLVPRLHDVERLPSSPEASPWVDPRGAQGGAQGSGALYPTDYRVRHPVHGFDVIVHVGVGAKGAIKVEAQAHKDGYRNPDVRGMYAPIRQGHYEGGMSQAEREESERLKQKGDDQEPVLDRGFGEGYEDFDIVEKSTIDVSGLVSWLKEERGIEHVSSSQDPGRFLCDFIYYCSLAESKRSSTSSPRLGPTPTLFIHVPPVGLPYKPEETREAIKDAIWWIAREAVA